jgi:BlaI family transcriptional regulator, penicillinase repressor
MGRPRAKELTERELQVMQAFWGRGDASATVAEVRDELAVLGPDLAYTTVATLVRILSEKGFLAQANNDRPFLYKPVRTYEDVSRRLLGDVLDKVFQGSRELLLVRLFEQERLTDDERARLRAMLDASEAEKGVRKTKKGASEP